jgi:hypothetical protein
MADSNGGKRFFLKIFCYSLEKHYLCSVLAKKLTNLLWQPIGFSIIMYIFAAQFMCIEKFE